eukprot:CAMPEP_0114492230 /NCGR_PEP_ID=MMETSP0109-20121206/3438_1 /TAXON_ID=29199 /ORGANISM="Chlorarachnion reptans, Strain CCCM449" /LENGTH=448 /DNA_ID=CAMNT_0001669047 /DNA_START=109 /DNA_END=1455 /DNA_ORIENTATION=-
MDCEVETPGRTRRASRGGSFHVVDGEVTPSGWVLVELHVDERSSLHGASGLEKDDVLSGWVLVGKNGTSFSHPEVEFSPVLAKAGRPPLSPHSDDGKAARNCDQTDGKGARNCDRADGKARGTAVSQPAVGPGRAGTWQVQHAAGAWQMLSRETSDHIEACYRTGRTTPRYAREGKDRAVDWILMHEYDDNGPCVRIKRSRPIRRLPTAAVSDAASLEDVHQSQTFWISEPYWLGNGCLKRELSGFKHKVLGYAREGLEYNIAYGQLAKMLRHGDTDKRFASILDRVDMNFIELYHSHEVAARFEATRVAFARTMKTKCLWVFHGTNADNVEEIMTKGFKVGGVDTGIDIKNGAAFGNGVYTSLSPDIPLLYGKCKTLILSLGVVGEVFDYAIPMCIALGQIPETADSWRPHPSSDKLVDDWIIFRSGAQLLPKYAFRFRFEGDGEFV